MSVAPPERAARTSGDVATGTPAREATVRPHDAATEGAARAAAHQVTAGLPVALTPVSASRPADPGPRAPGDPTPNETGLALPASVRAWAEPAFGTGLERVRIHEGPAAAGAAASISAQAFTVGNQITFAAGRYEPETVAGRHLLAHELAHSLQPVDASVIQRVGPEDPPFGYTKAERDLIQAEKAEERAKAAHTTAWRATVAGQVAGDLKSQASDLRTDVERSALAVVAARAALLTRLGARVPAGLAEDWSSARTSVELINAALEPDEKGIVPSDIPVDIQDYVRERLAPFYVLLRSWEVTRYNDAVAGAHNAYLVWRMNQMAIAGTRFADKRPPADAIPPPPPTMDVRNRAAAVDAARNAAAWKSVLEQFELSSRLIDVWATQMLPKDTPELQAVAQATGLHERQQELLRTRSYALKIPAIFYPKDEYAKPSPNDKAGAGAGTSQAVGYPWFFYLYRKPGDPDWYLEDLTAPDKRVNVHDQTAGEGFARFAAERQGWPISKDPPTDLWEQLNSKLRFPEGELHLTLPSGALYRLETTAPTSLSEYLGYAAMAVGAATLILFTAGAGTPAAIALVAGAGLGIASTVTGLAELEEQGMATTGDRARAGLMIAVDLASLLTLGLGRVAAGAARAGESASMAARLAGRFFVPVARLSVALDVTQLYVMTEEFVEQYRAVSNQPGLTDDQRTRARAKIALIGIASGALSLWSARSTMKDIAAHGSVSVDELMPSSLAGARPQAGAGPTVASGPARTTDLRLGKATLVEGAQLVDTLPAGSVHVELRRNRWGLVSEVAVVHGPPPPHGAKAFASDIALHQQVARIAQEYSGLLGEIRELLERLAAKFTGQSRGPLERELELAKLQNRIDDRLRRLGDPRGISAGERTAYQRDLESFRNQIEGHRQAIARGDPSTGRIAQQGTPAGHPVAPPGHTYHYNTVKQRWDIVPDVAGGPRLHVQVDPTSGLPTGRFSNLEQLDSMHVNGMQLSDPTAVQRLAAAGYEIRPGPVIVPSARVPATTAAAMEPLRVVNGKVEVTPHVRLDAASLGASPWYRQFWGKTLDTETMVALHGMTTNPWQTAFEPVTASLGRAGAETLWRRGSQYGLIDYIRYHIMGPGTGLERTRIFLAPEAANQFANNHIEGFMRRLRDSGKATVSFRVNYQSFAGPELRSFIDGMLKSGDQKLIQLLARDGGRFERLLKSARYDIRVVYKNGTEELYQASVVMGPPGPSRKGSVLPRPPVKVTQF